MLDPEMESELIKMGIASPVTKSVAGALYHQQLSRQVPTPCLPALEALRHMAMGTCESWTALSIGPEWSQSRAL